MSKQTIEQLVQQELVRGAVGCSMIIQTMDILRNTPFYKAKIKEQGRKWNTIVSQTLKKEAKSMARQDDGTYGELINLLFSSADHLGKFDLSSLKGVEGLLNVLSQHEQNRVRYEINIKVLQDEEE